MSISGGLKILVADDDMDTAETFAQLLRNMSHDARPVTDSGRVQEVAKSFRPQVVFLDIGMPGMDGYTVARALRAEHGEALWICAITGYGAPEDRAKSRRAGFDAHVQKPVDPAVLAAILSQFAAARH